MAESFADAGVPVFLADVKGDLAGMCEIGIDSDDMKKIDTLVPIPLRTVFRYTEHLSTNVWFSWAVYSGIKARNK